MQIKECMTENVSFVEPDTQIPQIARKMRDEDIGALPVVEGNRLIGMITDRDIVVRIVASGQDVRTAAAREAMSPKILYCFDDETVGGDSREHGRQSDSPFARRQPREEARRRGVPG